MPSVQEFRDSRGSIIASGVAYVISMKLEPRHGGHELPEALFAPALVGEYEERVLEAFKDVLGAHGGLWSAVTPERTIDFNLVSYRATAPTSIILSLDQFSRLLGGNLRSATVTEKLILDCLGAAVGGVEAVISKRCDMPIKVVATWIPGPDLTVKDAVSADGSQSQQRLAHLRAVASGCQKKNFTCRFDIFCINYSRERRTVSDADQAASQAVMIAYGMLFGVVALSNRATAASTGADIEAAGAAGGSE